MLVCTALCPAASFLVCLQVLTSAQWPDTKQSMLETATTAELPVGLFGFWESTNTVGREPAGHADCRPGRLLAMVAAGQSRNRRQPDEDAYPALRGTVCPTSRA